MSNAGTMQQTAPDMIGDHQRERLLRMLMTTSLEWTPTRSASALATSTAARPSVSTAPVAFHRVCKLVPVTYMRWATGMLFGAVGVATLSDSFKPVRSDIRKISAIALATGRSEVQDDVHVALNL